MLIEHFAEHLILVVVRSSVFELLLPNNVGKSSRNSTLELRSCGQYKRPDKSLFLLRADARFVLCSSGIGWKYEYILLK